MTDPAPAEAVDPAAEKLKALCDAAVEAFLLYGFRRTSMEDIAQKAGVSRAALYLHFRNKRDVFRSVVAHVFAEGKARFRATLDPKGEVAATVAEALLAKDGGLMERAMASPHGAELLGLGFEAAADIAVEGETELAGILTDYFAEVARHRGIDPATPPAEVADFVMRAASALKDPMAGVVDHRRRIRLLGQSAAALIGV